MKNTLLISAISVSLVGAGIFAIKSNNDAKPSYEERTTMSFSRKAQSWSRAQEYIKMFIADPVTGKIDPALVARAREQAAQQAGLRSNVGMEWAERGPDNVGGRTRALLVDNRDTTGNTLFTGGASSSLFKSTNGGVSWKPIDDLGDISGISSIAQGPNGTIYVGTGASFENHGGSGDSGQKGRGMYKSTDGETWEVLSSTVPSSNSTSDDWAEINRIAVDPTNDNRLWAACYNQGLMLSEDGGSTWEVAATNTIGLPIGSITEVQVADDGTVIMCTNGAVWVSPDGSVGSFAAATAASGSSMPSGNRTAVKFAPSNNDTVWAVASSGGELVGLYRSADRGYTWSLAQGPVTGIWDASSGLFNGQAYYDLALGVHLKDARIAYVGGVQLWKYDGALTRISLEFSNDEYYVHSDKHDVLFDPYNPGKMFVLSDGGVGVSYDYGETFQTANKGYQTFQCYDVAMHPDGRMMGGAQDNGTVEVTGIKFDGVSSGKEGVQVLGGDGYGCDYSVLTPIQFGSSYDESYNRGLAEGGLATMCTSNGRGPSCDAPENSRFYSQMRIWESANDPTSKDSIVLNNVNAPQAIVKGDGTTKTFSFDIEFIYSSAQLVPGSILVYAGAQSVADTSGNGTLYGDGTGTITYTGANKGELEVTFLNAPGSTETVWVEFDTKFTAGTKVELLSNTAQLPVSYTIPMNVNPGDVIKVQDPIQSLLAVGISANGSGVGITRNALKLEKSGEELEWINVSIPGYVSTFEFTEDGNHLFVGTGYFSGSNIYRVSGLNKLYTEDDLDSITVTSLGNLGNAVTGIAIDPNDPNNVIVTTGNYTSTGDHVFMSTNALTATSNAFSSIQGNLPQMPCFSAEFLIDRQGYALVGTDWGVWGTDNIFATGGSVTWTEENTGMAHTPVHAMRQQTLPWERASTHGTVYLGTHGRGFYESTAGTGVGEFSEGEWNSVEFISELNVYPNPMSSNGIVTFELAEDAKATIQIYNINGQMVKSVSNEQFNRGHNRVDFDVAELGRGTYFITVDSKDSRKVAKFVAL